MWFIIALLFLILFIMIFARQNDVLRITNTDMFLECRNKYVPNECILFANVHIIKPPANICFPYAKTIVFKNCNNDFIQTLLHPSYFPNAMDIYVPKQHCEYSTITRFKGVAFHLLNQYSRYASNDIKMVDSADTPF